MSKKTQPFFSIGVTTYDRMDLLKETLSSIIFQTFPDFEVIVGNDNPQQALSSELLDINDERISYVNHTANLGEMANMSDLLERSRGQYFTWLADDDLYAPTFLETVHKALSRYENQPVIFTSYVMGTHFKDESKSISSTECRRYTGAEFLKVYLSRSIMAIGCYGVFRKEYLLQIKGMEQLGRGFSPYADNWLVIKTALLDEVVYCDAPLIFFRTHEASISYTSRDVEAYLSAQKDLLTRSRGVFLSEPLAANFQDNLFLLLVWCLRDFGAVISRSGFVSLKQIREYIAFLQKHQAELRGTLYYWKIRIMLMKTAAIVFFHWAQKRASLLCICGRRCRGGYCL